MDLNVWWRCTGSKFQNNVKDAIQKRKPIYLGFNHGQDLLPRVVLNHFVFFLKHIIISIGIFFKMESLEWPFFHQKF
jgi:hypothetical protein